MQADVDISGSDIHVKECLANDSQVCFSITSKNALLRLTMNSAQLNSTIVAMESIIPNGYKTVENKDVVCSRVFDVTLKVVDVRVGKSRFGNRPDIRFYSGKKRKHAIFLSLTWDQFGLLFNMLKLMQKPTVVVA